MRELSQAMAAFFEATVELGISETSPPTPMAFLTGPWLPCTPRATPAWGGHQLVMGDSVLGARIYGGFPDFALGGPDDAGKTGIWIPGITKAQYHEALARWAGVPDWQLRRSFPEPSGAERSNLGFLL